MTQDEIAAIEARLAAITPGKWVACGWDPMAKPHVTQGVPEHACCIWRDNLPRTKADAEFIAAAPAAIRALLAEVRELRADWAATLEDMRAWRQAHATLRDDMATSAIARERDTLAEKLANAPHGESLMHSGNATCASQLGYYWDATGGHPGAGPCDCWQSE